MKNTSKRQQTNTSKWPGESSWFDKDSDRDLEDLTETTARRNPPLQSQIESSEILPCKVRRRAPKSSPADSDRDLKDFTETAGRRNPPLQWRLGLSLHHIHQVVVVERQVEVVLDEPLKGGDLLQRPPTDLHHLGGGGIGTGVCAQTA